jgi:hypothetical protein
MAMLDPDQNLKPKGFSWNPLIGVMYNNIPVGLIAVVIGAMIYFASR